MECAFSTCIAGQARPWQHVRQSATEQRPRGMFPLGVSLPSLRGVPFLSSLLRPSITSFPCPRPHQLLRFGCPFIPPTRAAASVTTWALPPESSGSAWPAKDKPKHHEEPQRELWKLYSEDGGDDVAPIALKPSPLLTSYEAVEAQLEALKAVYHPNGDIQVPYSGLEVLYNFAAIDPFNKGSTYFGERLNVAYFSQFSAKFSLRQFKPLLGMHSYDIVSALHLSPTRFTARVRVCASRDAAPAIFLFNMVKKESGHLKGCWVTVSLQRVDM